MKETRLHGPNRPIVIFPMLLLILFHYLLFSSPAQADIASVQAEITTINDQIADLNNNQIPPLEAEIEALQAGMTEARTFMNEFTLRNDWLVTENAVHRRRLREYEGKVLQLSMSYLDFFNAKEAWENSADPELRRAQILVMFRYLHGNSREPSQWELSPNTQADFVTMADLIVRQRAVARVGEALVLLGELTLQLVEAIKGVPSNMRDVAFQAIQFTTDATLKLLPDNVVSALNNTCLNYVPYLEAQKQRAELLADQLNEIRNREEFGGEPGRVAALEKARALVVYEQDILARLEPELANYLAHRTTVEANFVTVQEEINEKQEELDALRQTRRTYMQNLIDKQFELTQLQEQEAINQNGGPTNYVTALSSSSKNPYSPTSNCYTVAADGLSSSLLNLPTYSILSASANYTTEKPAQCEYSYKVGDDTFTGHENYHVKQIFSAAVTNPVWRKVSPTGDLNIVGNRAYGTAPGTVPLQAVLSPAFVSESYGPYQHCSSDYLPVGSGEKLATALNIGVRKVEETLFIPYFYYSKTASEGLSGTAQFDAMKNAADTYGRGIDLFVGGAVQKWGSVALYYTVINADGSRSASSMTPGMKPEGDLTAFEINNQMKVLGNGAATVWPLLFDRDGLPVPAGTVNGLAVTGNTVVAGISANGVSGLTPNDNATVVIDEAAQFAVSVPGPANMANYQVNWRYFIYKTSGYPTGWVTFARHDGAATTQFSGAAGNWLSPNPVTLNDPADFNQKFKVEFDIVRKYDSIVVYTGKFENIRSIVKGKRFFLANKTTGETYPGVNYFLFRGLSSYSPNITSLNLELRLDLGDGRSLLIPLTDTIKGFFYDAGAVEAQDLGFLNLYEKYMVLYLSSVDECGAVPLGIYELKEADAETLLSKEGIAVERTANTVMSNTDVNLLRVSYRETAGGPMYLVKSCGPSSMQGFTARWTFFDDTTVDTPFSTVGITEESLTPMVGSVKKVEILNAQGNVASSVCFLGACGTGTNKASLEANLFYRVVTEYRFDGTTGGYQGQLTRLSKNDIYLGSHYDLDFTFPAGFPQILVKTVNDINGESLPHVTNFAVADGTVSFDVTKPEAGAYTLLSILKPPSFGTLAIEGNAVIYTPRTGFDKTDRFQVRVDGRLCDIEPNVYYYNLEGEADYSGPHPVVRLSVIFPTAYRYGSYALGFVPADAAFQALASVTVSQPPAALVVDVTSGSVGIKRGTLSGYSSDLFKLNLTTAGGSAGGALPQGASPLGVTTGEATVNVWYYTDYPEFTAYKNRDCHIAPGFITHRFFPNLSDVRYVKIDYWLHGSMLLDGQPLDYGQIIPVADLGNLIFRPATGYTGPAAFGGRGSSDNTTWTAQTQIGGRIIESAGMAELIRLLQILSGMAIFPPEAALVPDIGADGKISLPEALRLLQEISGLRD